MPVHPQRTIRRDLNRGFEKEKRHDLPRILSCEEGGRESSGDAALRTIAADDQHYDCFVSLFTHRRGEASSRSGGASSMTYT
ncbi:hypothetical protein O3P69_003747 [Scylla paramamosain]|uniref:Uncharacterized protein n=1 Tax=Scylla paramamosain TaxID=85552 RepID=A0AAW0UFG3_SCYPA